MSANLEAVWTSTVSQWTSPAAHDELFRVVHLHDAWLWAARSYREYAKAHSGDEIAQRQLKKLQGYLMVTLAPRAKPMRNPYRATVSILVMMMLALGAGTAFTRFASSNAAAQDDEWEAGLAVAPEPEPMEDVVPTNTVPTLDTNVIASTR